MKDLNKISPNKLSLKKSPSTKRSYPNIININATIMPKKSLRQKISVKKNSQNLSIPKISSINRYSMKKHSIPKKLFETNSKSFRDSSFQ